MEQGLGYIIVAISQAQRRSLISDNSGPVASGRLSKWKILYLKKIERHVQIMTVRSGGSDGVLVLSAGSNDGTAPGCSGFF